ncbi:hypothetical protein GXW78_17475 [Roseomonas terrae]|uniref:J domain-containing protein n=1 Tax=Neoroseomonas terrae TaxID=424799 RepID=A0ABS5EKA9_9PROT|nr:hypothetical protein [Neoroseomonas terrae]MBR0651465.1 hypothetical protein [Neoroseomonas terrae]
MSVGSPPERPLREWPLEQLVEQAALHATDAAALGALQHETHHRRGARARALEARLGRMILDCAAGPDPGPPVRRLRATLAAAGEEIARLRARVSVLEQTQAAAEPACPYRRVHLAPDAPAWLIAEVRRAFRRRYHPDTEPDQRRRQRSEDVFKRLEAHFAEIERRRGS